jgi:hypothetical protein
MTLTRAINWLIDTNVMYQWNSFDWRYLVTSILTSFVLVKSKHTKREYKGRSYNNWRIRKTLYRKWCDNDNSIDDNENEKNSSNNIKENNKKIHTSIQSVSIHRRDRLLFFYRSQGILRRGMGRRKVLF